MIETSSGSGSEHDMSHDTTCCVRSHDMTLHSVCVGKTILSGRRGRKSQGSLQVLQASKPE